MHELSIASAVLDAVRAEGARYPGTCPAKVGIRVGALAGVDPDALSFCFESLLRGTKWERLRLEIETCPRRHRCRSCGDTFDVADYDATCPVCRTMQPDCIGGDELELAYLEVDEL